jgi:hypothetical protein
MPGTVDFPDTKTPARTAFADGRARPPGPFGSISMRSMDMKPSQYIELIERAAARWRTRHRRVNADNLQARNDDVSP